MATLVATSPSSGELLRYKYDVHGRLVQSFQTNEFDYGGRTQIAFDAADNRVEMNSKNTVFFLNTGQSISSPDGRSTLVMQADGNLVLSFQGIALWAAATNGSPRHMRFQPDGNLVVYGGASAVWASGTGGNYAAELVLQNDGNLVIYSDSGAALWSTNTGGH